ncbi:MAG TPA: VOC family protein [Candidatus Dormibacteraeota bacterium]|nr:VOC family protein [Candidatus Dormibacteraeota bacterium]
MPLRSARLVAFVPVLDLDRARNFYGSVLGLTVVEETPFAILVDAAGTPVRLTVVGQLTPQPFTVVGWEVGDVTAVARDLAARGVPATRYAGMDQDGDGVWTSPSGARVAWFADPDGNTLSITQPA